MKLRKRFRAEAGSREGLQKQCKALQELCGRQRLEMDALMMLPSQVSFATVNYTNQLPVLVCNLGRDASLY